jgi:hypothetical protein
MLENHVEGGMSILPFGGEVQMYPWVDGIRDAYRV